MWELRVCSKWRDPGKSDFSIEKCKNLKKFYHDLFQLDVILDQDGNLIEMETPM